MLTPGHYPATTSFEDRVYKIKFRKSLSQVWTNMAAVDPTYPLYPLSCILAATLLLLVLTTNLVRQSWNLGIGFLCFWLFLETLTNGVDAVLWSDNADIKLHVYCDIGEPCLLPAVHCMRS